MVEAMDIVGESWRLLVLFDLQEGCKRFNERKRSTGARSRTLSGPVKFGATVVESAHFTHLPLMMSIRRDQRVCREGWSEA